MDNAELNRLRELCGRAYGLCTRDDIEEMQDLARLAVAEIREHRRLLADLQAALKRAAIEAV